MDLAAQLQARAAARDANRPLWERDEHPQTVQVEVPEKQLQEAVTGIVIHAARVTMGGGDAAHFRIYLQLSGDGSVELDSYGLQQAKTMLRIQHRAYAYSETIKKMGLVEVPIKTSFTVRDAVDTLVTNNRDRYQLDSTTGSGCRYWCQVVIADFIRNKWVDEENAGSVETLTATLKADPQFGSVNIPVPAPQGTFY